MKVLMGCATLGYKSRVVGSQMGASTTISVQMCLAFERALSPYLLASGFVVNLSRSLLPTAITVTTKTSFFTR